MIETRAATGSPTEACVRGQAWQQAPRCKMCPVSGESPAPPIGSIGSIGWDDPKALEVRNSIDSLGLELDEARLALSITASLVLS
jgi:hypothetical protein